MGLPSVLFVIFLVLKLCEVIDWSWIYVFMPLIVEAVITIVVIAGGLTYLKLRR